MGGMDVPSAKDGRKTLSILLTDEEYKNLKLLSVKSKKSMAAIGRDFITKGLSGELTENNLEIIVPVIREQIKSVIEPMLERSISLTAKTCIQAGTAAYLSADSILKFVPKEQREDVRESYEKARKQAIEYTRSKVKLEADE